MLRSVLAFKNLFALFITVCFAYGVWEARNYAYLAKVPLSTDLSALGNGPSDYELDWPLHRRQSD